MIKTKIIAKIEGMYCSACPPKLIEMLEKVDGVLAVTASFQATEAEVIYDANLLSYKRLTNAVNRAGFTVSYYANNERISDFDEKESVN